MWDICNKRHVKISRWDLTPLVPSDLLSSAKWCRLPSPFISCRLDCHYYKWQKSWLNTVALENQNRSGCFNRCFCKLYIKTTECKKTSSDWNCFSSAACRGGSSKRSQFLLILLTGERPSLCFLLLRAWTSRPARSVNSSGSSSAIILSPLWLPCQRRHSALLCQHSTQSMLCLLTVREAETGCGGRKRKRRRKRGFIFALWTDCCSVSLSEQKESLHMHWSWLTNRKSLKRRRKVKLWNKYYTHLQPCCRRRK